MKKPKLFTLHLMRSNTRKGNKNRPATLAMTASSAERVLEATPTLAALYEFLRRPLP